MNTLSIEDLQTMSKQQIEAVTAFASTVSKGMQDLASETAEFSKHSMTSGAEMAHKLMSAKSLETAIQIQGDYAKSAFEGFLARSTKVNALVGKIATEAFKPLKDAASAALAKA